MAMPNDIEINHVGGPSYAGCLYVESYSNPLYAMFVGIRVVNATCDDSASLDITRDDAIRLRDWLNAWLEETK